MRFLKLKAVLLFSLSLLFTDDLRAQGLEKVIMGYTGIGVGRKSIIWRRIRVYSRKTAWTSKSFTFRRARRRSGDDFR